MPEGSSSAQPVNEARTEVAEKQVKAVSYSWSRFGFRVLHQPTDFVVNLLGGTHDHWSYFPVIPASPTDDRSLGK
jgi:hypothetical protein